MAIKWRSGSFTRWRGGGRAVTPPGKEVSLFLSWNRNVNQPSSKVSRQKVQGWAGVGNLTNSS